MKKNSDQWPFERLDLAYVNSLPPDDRKRLEGIFILAAAQVGYAIAKAPRCLNRGATLYQFPAVKDAKPAS